MEEKHLDLKGDEEEETKEEEMKEEEPQEEQVRGYKEEKSKPAKHSKILKDEINIKLKPKTILHFILIIVVLLGIFYLGRASVACGSVDTDNSSSFSLSGWVTGVTSELFSGDEDVVEEPVVEEPVEEETPPEEVEETPEPEVKETVEAVAEEVITSYNNVALEIKGVAVDWKGNWGKIIGIDYSISNQESGTIKPDYFLLEVEKYELEKQVSLPPSSRTIKSKVKGSSSATVVGGFAYSEITLGDITGVQITVSMYDASGKLMASTIKTVDLSG